MPTTATILGLTSVFARIRWRFSMGNWSMLLVVAVIVGLLAQQRSARAFEPNETVLGWRITTSSDADIAEIRNVTAWTKTKLRAYAPPYASATVLLILGCNRLETAAIIVGFEGTPVANVLLQYQVDDRPMKAVDGRPNGDNSLAIIGKPAKEFITSLSSGKRLTIPAFNVRDTVQTLQFEIEGIDIVMTRIAAACRWQ